MFDKNRLWMLVLIIVLSIAALAAVIFGVTTHREPGFMEQTPEWTPGDFPLDVCVRSYASERVLRSDAEAADYTISVINGRLGFEAYRSTNAATCRVLLTMGAPAEMDWQEPGGSATIRRGGCDIETANVIGEVRTMTVYHELGHCLGLAHDDFELSIMRRTQTESSDGTMPPWFTDHDRSLIRSTYLRE
jgi:hypothetical protein